MYTHTQLSLFETGACQRWRLGRHSWRHTSEGGFNPRDYTVQPIREADARGFVTSHHYSHAYPAARLRYGLIQSGRLVGAVVLGVPMSEAVLTRPFPTLTPYRQALELSRLILLDEVPANAESWMVGQVFDRAAAEGVRGVLAFADPARGHVGIVYQAHNATYTGRGTARTLTILPDGSVLTDRAASKVRNGERGAAGVRARLEALGAPAGAGLDGMLAAIGARKARHHGNHRFAWAIGTRAQRRGTPIGLPALPYPKTPDTIAA